MEKSSEKYGNLVIQTLAMPQDTNINGDIFGGWILSQMDIGGSIAARKFIDSNAVVVSMDSMKFISPVKVGDIIFVYADLLRIKERSVSYHIKTLVLRKNSSEKKIVTEADFTYVKVGKNKKLSPLDHYS